MTRPIWREQLDELQPYQPGKRASDFKAELGLAEAIKLSSNETPFHPTHLAIEAMRAVASRVNRYPDGSTRTLRRGLGEFLSVKPENIMVGNGSNELIRILAQMVLEPGDEVLMGKPSFVVYPMVTQMFGGTAVQVPVDDGWSLDLGAMASSITRRTKIVFLANPNNPTGTIYGRAAFESFLESAREVPLLVVDEAYFEFVDEPDYPNALDYFSEEGNLVVLRTFSKVYGLAGLRVGYGVAPRQVVIGVDKIREPFNVNTMAQIAAYASLKAKEEIATRHHLNLEARRHVLAVLDEVGLEYASSQANFVWVKVPDGPKAFNDLLMKGIIVRQFGELPFVRITFGTERENRKLAAALRSAFR
ncbi:MAG: histidinol-phosphate transaminase [Actinobacteria bacterium]|nr:MAG: histidinol-phosphate transaminase [Actinomycetota bacterium]